MPIAIARLEALFNLALADADVPRLRGPVARFYERLLGFAIGEFEPPRWAQLLDPAGGVHLNIQGEPWYEPPTWPERAGEQAKTIHLEVQVDDLELAVATAIEAGGVEAPRQPPDRDPQRIRILSTPPATPFVSSYRVTSRLRQEIRLAEPSSQI